MDYVERWHHLRDRTGNMDYSLDRVFCREVNLVLTRAIYLGRIAR
jgi:hypothetical protein